MQQDLLVEKAIILRDAISRLEYCLEENHMPPTFADKDVLQQLDFACKACVSLGFQCINTHLSQTSGNVATLFQKLVESEVIDHALSKRLLSLMAFQKLIRQANLIKGKNIHLKITPRHLEDFHSFTHHILLA